MRNVCEYECELRIFITNMNIFVICADPYTHSTIYGVYRYQCHALCNSSFSSYIVSCSPDNRLPSYPNSEFNRFIGLSVSCQPALGGLRHWTVSGPHNWRCCTTHRYIPLILYIGSSSFFPLQIRYSHRWQPSLDRNIISSVPTSPSRDNNPSHC